MDPDPDPSPSLFSNNACKIGFLHKILPKNKIRAKMSRIPNTDDFNADPDPENGKSYRKKGYYC
jgi:hypothetical protein